MFKRSLFYRGAVNKLNTYLSFLPHFILSIITYFMLGPIVQSVVSLIADPGVLNSILAWPLTFVEFDNEKFSKVILFLPLIQEMLLSVTSESMCTEYWLTA